MAIINKVIAALSITEITDELLVSPAEVIDSSTLGLTVTPRATAQAGDRYIVSVKLDGVEQPLQLISFTPIQIADREPRNLQFAGSIAGISVITAEVSIDSSVSILTLDDVSAPMAAVPNITLRMDTGDGGLAGFDITAVIVDPAVARFTDVTCPFPLSSSAVAPDGSSATIVCVDLGDAVGANQIAILLANFVLEALAIGETEIILTINALDDDDGFVIRRVIRTSTVSVN